MARRNHKNKSMKNSRKSRGGSAWQYTTAAYGDPTHQVAGAGNTIAVNNLAGKSFCTGGSRKGGKGVLTDIAVPAVLLYANNVFKRGKSATKGRKYRTRRYTRGKR